MVDEGGVDALADFVRGIKGRRNETPATVSVGDVALMKEATDEEAEVSEGAAVPRAAWCAELSIPVLPHKA
jgi:hypothetical protein